MSEEMKPGHNGPWPVLDTEERRILGVLVEKAKTTPDAYPLSVNALVTGSNQKSNREPLLNLDEDDVLDALNRCKARGLVAKVIGGRVERWRHMLYEEWHVDKVELAILAELLLRGPQTEGELRTRASRMEPIDDLDMLREKLRPLVDRNLVVYLSPEERRGAVLTHGFHATGDLERLKKQAAAGAPASVVTATASATAVSAPRNDAQVAALESALGSLREEMSAVMQALHSANERIETLETLTKNLSETLVTTMQELAILKQSLGG